jgi:Protein of unknown function (DUF1449)
MTDSSSFLAFLNHWWNLPFLVMLLLVAAYFVLQLIGLAGHGGMDHDAHPDADADAHVEGDTWQSLLAFFGVGRVPFMVVWITLFLFAGFTGLIVNRLVYLSHGGRAPAWLFPLALVVALVVGALGVRLFSRVAARLVDVGGDGATSKQQLVGKLGVVASAKLDGRFGEVRIHDGRDEILVHGHLAPGEAALARGARVVVIDYDAQREMYEVSSSPDMDVAG